MAQGVYRSCDETCLLKSGPPDVCFKKFFNNSNPNHKNNKKLYAFFFHRTSTPQTLVNIQGSDIQIVDSFKQLGTHLNKKLDSYSDLWHKKR